MGIIKMINLHRSKNIQLVLFMAAIMAFLMVAEAKDLKFWKTESVGHFQKSEWFKLDHMSPNGDEEVRLGFTSYTFHYIFKNTTSTTICFRTEDDSYTLEVGSKGFGFQLDCLSDNHDQCWDQDYNAYLIPSFVKSVSPLTWSAPITGVDSPCLPWSDATYRSANPSNHPAFYYEMSTAQFESSNLPGKDEEVFLKCYDNDGGMNYLTNLDDDLVLSTWRSHTMHLNAPEQKCSTSGK